MPFLYVYSPDDFVGGLPAESGAKAAGKGSWTLEMKPGAEPTLIEVSDDDGIFDEVDGGQSLASLVEIDGESYGADTSVHTAYDLINTDSGHQVTSIHFGGTGYQQGAVDGLISTQPLLPGESYDFNYERTSHKKDNAYEDFVACFTAGSRIATPGGLRPVEGLAVGDWVDTLDHGAQRLRWIGTRRVRAQGRFAPVRFLPGALDNTRGFEVSPQHRMLLSGGQVEMHFGAQDVLVPAKSLVNGRDVLRRTQGWVTYVHLLFDAHEIVFVEGCASESLLLSDPALCGFGKAAQEEASALFGTSAAARMIAARPCLRAQDARSLAWA